MTLSNGDTSAFFAPLVGVALSLSSLSSTLVFLQGNTPSLSGGISPAWIQASVTAFSVLLTGGLVYLYHKQRELNALEYTADVQAEGHRPTGESELLDICVSNLGRGAATDLSLRIETSFPDTDEYSGQVVEETPKKGLEQPNTADVRNEWVRTARNYIGPEQYFVRFWTTIPVRWATGGDDVNRATSEDDLNKTTLSNLASELPDSVDCVRLTITLDYQDQLNDDESEIVVDDVLPLKTGESLEFLFSRGMTNDEYEQRSDSDDNDSDDTEDPFKSLSLHRPQLTDEFESKR